MSFSLDFTQFVNETHHSSHGFCELLRAYAVKDSAFESILNVDIPSLVPLLRKFNNKITPKRDGRKNYTISQQELTAIEYYHSVCEIICSRIDDIVLPEEDELTDADQQVLKLFEFLRNLVDRLEKTWCCINRQQMLDFSDELRRYHKIVDYCNALRNPLYYPSAEIRQISDRIKTELFGCCRFTRDKETAVEHHFKTLQEALKSSSSLTSEEKAMVNQAMQKDFHSGGTGHWFTCSKGHYYCITECGGAMQTANCPECGEVIGGTNHTYVPTAKLATDMDGAARPAWSAGHDIRNFMF